MTVLSNEMPDDVIIQKATEIVARRFLRSAPMTSIADITNYCFMRLAEKEQEIFCAAFFDSQLCMIDFHQMFYGTINEVFVHPREIVKRALDHNAASVILVHNHPSGNILPSKNDKYLTQRVKEALALVDVTVIDHIVVGGARYFSFAEKGLI